MQEKRRIIFITDWDSEWEDAQAVGWELIECEEELKGELNGGYFIAMAIDPDIDYHFYRMNNDGTWSDKRRAGKVGIGIKNPLVDVYKKEYDILIGYFY